MRRTAACLAFVLLTSAAVLSAQYADSVRGAKVIQNRGCLSCHSVLGEGGDEAPDLGRPEPGIFSPAAFAASLWNHAPEMWRAMARKNKSVPRVSDREVRDVFAYLYSMRYFEPAGNAESGQGVFREKRCYRCHALVDTGAGSIGPPVSQWPALSDPVRFLEAMWNHGAQMRQESAADKIPWPSLTAKQLADLLAYVYSLPDLPPRRARIELGKATAGMKVFDDMQCGECHTLLEAHQDALALANVPRTQRTLTGLAVAMWNHRPIMDEWAEETGLAVRNFEGGQMAKLLSFLFEEGLLEERGDVTNGSKLWGGKGCASCHDTGRQDVAPLTLKSYTVTDLTAGVWRHGPALRDKMAREGVAWPAMTARDVADIIAWLNARAD